MPFKGYRITSPFGYRTHPITGKRNVFHTGIDLVKSHRAPIEAFTEGTVLFAGFGAKGSGFGGYGNVVLIRDKNNRGQVYAHLDSVSVKKGQQVKRGQTVGTQGNSGNSAGSHLHFEVRKKAQASAPYGWDADRPNNCLEPTAYLLGYYVAQAGAKASSDGNMSNIQSTLNSRYKAGLKVDGKYGPQTKAALVKGWQSELNKQFKAGLKVDGKWGPKSRNASVTIRKGATGNLTWLLQAVLSAHGYNTKGVDGKFGEGTYEAVKAFQKDAKLSVDGVPGKTTFDKLFV